MSQARGHENRSVAENSRQQQLQPDDRLHASVAISATFTAEPVQEPLAFWLRELDIDLPVRFAGYSQVFQQLLDPTGLLASNRNGISVVLLRFEDWFRFSESAAPDRLEEDVRHLISSIRAASASFASPILVCLCPASPEFLQDADNAALAARMEALLESELRSLSTAYLVTPSEISRYYPVENYYDPHSDELGHVPYTPQFFAALATMLARKIYRLRATPYKVIVLDCDETLWKGICGEDGPEGVCLDDGRRALHEFMAAQREAGMLLCLCSKNNRQDVFDTFHAHPEMPLKLEHFVASRLNWEPKPVNLRALAADLDLGLDSFIFVDDNPKECAEVEAACPEVLSIALPEDPDQIGPFLNQIWAFDHLKITKEDAARSAMYAQSVERRRLEKQASSLQEFLEALQIKVGIGTIEPDQIARVSQLTLRTNQMNFTTIRRSESQINTLVNSGEVEALTVRVSDRFGDYGLTGAMLFRCAPDEIVLDTFLLSCRALGRGVEHRMLARLGEIAIERGLSTVEVLLIPTARNRPALEFLESIGLEFRQPVETGLLFRFPSEYLRRVRYKPNGKPAPVAAAPAASSNGVTRPQIDFIRIAKTLSRPEQVLAQVRAAERQPARDIKGQPRTDLERELAELWASLLRVPAVGVDDNFFDLGGHSLLAVQLLSRVREKYNVELSLKVVYTGTFTVAELAKAIELAQIEQTGSGEYAQLLEEIEGLSDEEVRALLAEEERSS